MTARPEALTAAAAAAAIARKRLSAVDLVEDCLVRSAADSSRAWVRLDAEGARRAALARDKGMPIGPLHGVPIGIKDIIDTADLPTECGSPTRAGHRPARNAVCVDRLLAAGAIVLGKTVTTEFAHLHPGPTANPHDPTRTPGGSSSGSAAAVAASMVPVALGTQTGGSVIRPSSFCGVFGFKSTLGRTDVTGVAELARSFDTVGWFARDAADLVLLAQVLLDAPCFVPGPVPARPRIGVTMTPAMASAMPEMRAAVESAVAKLAPAGYDVRPVELPADFAGLNPHHRITIATEVGRALTREWAEQRRLLSDKLRSFIETGLAAPDGSYERAQAAIAAARRDFDGLMSGWDALLCPSAAGEAPVGLDTTGDPVFNSMWSLLGAPCVSLPFATGPNGLPVGIQLVGGRGRDEGLLALAEAISQRLGIRVKHP
ncbi:MAG: amidase [Alphaproteobacteria bacterium]|nr:amidase [Alphaproteobacteria bacterium]